MTITEFNKLKQLFNLKNAGWLLTKSELLTLDKLLHAAGKITKKENPAIHSWFNKTNYYGDLEQYK